jgi:hypothetical protein
VEANPLDVGHFNIEKETGGKYKNGFSENRFPNYEMG